MKRYVALDVDWNYYWKSPLPEDLIAEVRSVVCKIDRLIPKFISKKYKKIFLYLTDDPEVHGDKFSYGFFFYIDEERVANVKGQPERQNEIFSIIKSGLISMGELHDWNESVIENLFADISIEKLN